MKIVYSILRNVNPNYEGGLYPIDTISYGVQDLVYTRVFAMIVVKVIFRKARTFF